MEITGRLTADAKVSELSDGRKVVGFSVAINDSYRDRQGERKQLTTYFNCSYWLSDKIAVRLTKGSIVSLFGRVGVRAYNNMDGEAVGSLTFHCNNIKFISAAHRQEVAAVNTKAAPAEEAEDLPF